MAESIPVSCKINRCWDTVGKEFDGDDAEGELIAFTVQSADDDNSKIIPAGIVVLDENQSLGIEEGTMKSVPVEFITRL